MPSPLRFALVLALLAFITLDVRAEDLLARAADALAQQDHEVAISLFEQHLEGHPEDGSAHYQLGSALMASGEFAAAIPHYERAATLGFQVQGAGYRVARCHAALGKADEALDQLVAIADAGFALPRLIVTAEEFNGLREEERYMRALQTMRDARFPCKASEDHRAFDFWIGSWAVSAGGAHAGTNEVYPILGDCVIFENWTSAGGGTGKSFNFFDANDGLWHQMWVDDRGNVLNLAGKIEDGSLHYAGIVEGQNGAPDTMHRLVFTPLDDGSVRQHWTSSTDGGETWQIAFDGHYVRRGEPQRAVQ